MPLILSLRNCSPTKECIISRLSGPNLESDAGPSGQVYAQIKKAIGSVPNTFAAIAAHGPAAPKSVLAADTVLASGSLSERDQETIKLIISGAAGCDYCVAAHSLLGKLAGLKPDELMNIRDGKPTGDAERDALARFVRKLTSSFLPCRRYSVWIPSGRSRI
ncbi:carboxymuconolactone decarboxylase family protein [Bradyrhizobium genosp. P]|uniref:carboxymuconolactone decarboxylase family protein n=1 Tax=Bradyrhizobium genosp. P TaxID=83641 RepID=UPI003CF42E80